MIKQGSPLKEQLLIRYISRCEYIVVNKVVIPKPYSANIIYYNFSPMHVNRSDWEAFREGEGGDAGLALVPQPVGAFTLAFVALAATTTSTSKR